MSSEIEKLVDLSCVISWLENGCDPRKAAAELRLYQPRLEAKDRELALLHDNQADYVALLNDRHVAQTAAEARIAEKDARIAELEAKAEKCFACGANGLEDCRRPPDKACGREYLGGTRARSVLGGRDEA